MIDYIALYFGIAVLLAIVALAIMAALIKKTPVDRYEDGAESNLRAAEIIEESRPMPLDGAEQRRHVRAGASK